MKYLHGERTFLFEHEKNMLDRAIDRYDSLATKYYSKSNDTNSDSPDVRDSRKKELADIKINWNANASVSITWHRYRRNWMPIENKGQQPHKAQDKKSHKNKKAY